MTADPGGTADTAHVGRLLREARLAAGLTQAGLAARTEVPQPNISAYESGRRSPTVRTLVRLLGACDARLAWEPSRAP